MREKVYFEDEPHEYEERDDGTRAHEDFVVGGLLVEREVLNRTVETARGRGPRSEEDKQQH